MTPRKFQRKQQKGAMAKARAKWQEFCKARREQKLPYPSFERWLGIEEKEPRHAR